MAGIPIKKEIDKKIYYALSVLTVIFIVFIIGMNILQLSDDWYKSFEFYTILSGLFIIILQIFNIYRIYKPLYIKVD